MAWHDRAGNACPRIISRISSDCSLAAPVLNHNIIRTNLQPRNIRKCASTSSAPPNTQLAGGEGQLVSPVNQKGGALCESLALPGDELRAVVERVQIGMLEEMRETAERSQQGEPALLWLLASTL